MPIPDAHKYVLDIVELMLRWRTIALEYRLRCAELGSFSWISWSVDRSIKSMQTGGATRTCPVCSAPFPADRRYCSRECGQLAALERQGASMSTQARSRTAQRATMPSTSRRCGRPASAGSDHRGSQGADMMNLSPGRRAWLERLAREGVADRPRGRVGCDCMRAGWTEWAWRDLDTGEIFGTDALTAKHGAGNVPWAAYETIGERLTSAGRKLITPSLLARFERDAPKDKEKARREAGPVWEYDQLLSNFRSRAAFAAY